MPATLGIDGSTVLDADLKPIPNEFSSRLMVIPLACAVGATSFCDIQRQVGVSKVCSAAEDPSAKDFQAGMLAGTCP